LLQRTLPGSRFDDEGLGRALTGRRGQRGDLNVPAHGRAPVKALTRRAASLSPDTRPGCRRARPRPGLKSSPFRRPGHDVSGDARMASVTQAPACSTPSTPSRS
jgi:hypothetical protein